MTVRDVDVPRPPASCDHLPSAAFHYLPSARVQLSPDRALFFFFFFSPAITTYLILHSGGMLQSASALWPKVPLS